MKHSVETQLNGVVCDCELLWPWYRVLSPDCHYSHSFLNPLEAQSAFKDLKHQQSLVFQLLYLHVVFGDFTFFYPVSSVKIIFPSHFWDDEIKGRKSSEKKILKLLKLVWIIKQVLKHEEKVPKGFKDRLWLESGV